MLLSSAGGNCLYLWLYSMCSDEWVFKANRKDEMAEIYLSDLIFTSRSTTNLYWIAFCYPLIFPSFKGKINLKCLHLCILVDGVFVACLISKAVKDEGERNFEFY